MEAKEALNILDVATGDLKMNRKDHQVIGVALATLYKLVEPQKKPARKRPARPKVVKKNGK